MKHAILIMAHKNYSFLHHLIEYFEHDCYVFVHIDKKSEITKDEIACLRQMPQVAGVYQKYSVHWGGFSILKCELFLLKTAMKNCDADYFHLISGQDYPIKPLSYFLDFFKEDGLNYLFHIHLPNPRWEHNTYERFQYYYLFDLLRDKKKGIRWSNRIIKWQKKIKYKRRIPDYFDHMYGGSQWFSLSVDGLKEILIYTQKHPRFLRRLHYTFAPEECYFATVGTNILRKETIRNNHCRFIRWSHENGNYPANLSMKHFHFLVESKALFARKLEMPLSENLLKNIDSLLLSLTKFSITETGGWVCNNYLQYCYHKEILLLVHDFCIRRNITSVLDMGCGSGVYVAALRRLGIPTTGYDANPYTPILSANLLPNGDCPCGIADLTEDLEAEEKFDFVICMDVLTYIPHPYRKKAVSNLEKLSSKYILISLSTDIQEQEKQMILQEFYAIGLKVVNDIVSNDNYLKGKNINQRIIVFSNMYNN